jgi:hypothetical protein
MSKKHPVIMAAVTAFCCAFLQAPLAFSGEEGLYPAAPPRGSAFIRFLNAANPTPLAVKIRSKSFGSEALGAISPYAPVQKGEADISLGGSSATVTLKEGTYYTAMLVKGHLSVLEEPPSDNKLKAQIVLINASSTPAVSLKTADGATGVVSDVGAAKLEGRAVNAVTAPFSVYAAEKKIAAIDPQALERGARYAVIVYDGANGKPAVTFN